MIQVLILCVIISNIYFKNIAIKLFYLVRYYRYKLFIVDSVKTGQRH